MGKLNVVLYDEVGKSYKRKNKYLEALALLEEQKASSTTRDKIDIKNKQRELKINKSKHPYNIKLTQFKELEKEFKQSLKNKLELFEKDSSLSKDETIKKLEIEYEESKLKLDFYKQFIDLTYDAEFEYKKSVVKARYIPLRIKKIEKVNRLLLEAQHEKTKLEKQDHSTKDQEIEKAIKEFKELANKALLEIDNRAKEGLISKKAKVNAKQKIKRNLKDTIQVKKQEDPIVNINEYIKSKKHEKKLSSSKMKKAMNKEIGEIRRSVPIEIEKTFPINSLVSILLPGLGQGLNKQPVKMLLFALASFFTYFLAIPYALGYGNYQGEGIAGLINLAEGGPRIYKSMIFMIEGVVAIFLVLIAILLFYISFRDVLRTEKKEIKGVRVKNWFETRTAITEGGFPYLVSLPALIVIVFIVLVPVVTTALLSFTNMDPNHQSKFNWVGLSNYRLIATGSGLAGSVFWLIFVWTIIWTIFATSLAIFIGFVLALLVNNERVKGKKFFRTIYILPWAVPAFITIMYFSIMMSPGGAITSLLENITGSKVDIKNSTTLTRTALVLMQGWLGSAYVFLLTTGVLQAIPNDLYEAADIDGASNWKKLMKITIPLVLFQIAPLLVTQYTFNFNNFSAVFLFNSGGPFNPQKYGNLAGSSDLLISYIYKLTMVNQYQAIAAAITILISLGLMLFAFIGFINSKGFKEGRL